MTRRCAWRENSPSGGAQLALTIVMTMKRALQLILVIGVVGAAFSGTLTYREFFGASAASCPALGTAGTVFGYPACVYGFFMYLIVVAVAIWGLVAGRREVGAERAEPRVLSPRRGEPSPS
jgi:uncharacterized membrane protein